MTKNNSSTLPSILLAFFVMGFVDMVGTATNYVKADFALSDTLANFLPTMVFFWFLIVAVPTGLLMNRIGKKKTVVLSLALTSVSMVLPVLSYSYPMMLVCFCLVGIGNALMQVSLNPLVQLVTDDSHFVSTLTFGQFVKAIASFITPILASWLAVRYLNWRFIFIVFMVVSLLATLSLGDAKVLESQNQGKKSARYFECFGLLGNKSVLLLFFGILCHCGVDVGINTCAPKLIMERTFLPLETASKATSVYFLFRTVGCLSGSFILSRVKDKIFFFISVILMALSMLGLFFLQSKTGIYVCLGLIGFGNSNIFPVIFSRAIFACPDKTNEVSGLMIMGLIGGSIFPLFMGIMSDILGSQIGSVTVISIGVAYLICLAMSFFKPDSRAFISR